MKCMSTGLHSEVFMQAVATSWLLVLSPVFLNMESFLAPVGGYSAKAKP